MKERPIIMSGDNPKLILSDRKTQTRRMVKPEIDSDLLDMKHPAHSPFQGADGIWRWMSGVVSRGENDRRCKFGVAGDRLWVRETHFRFGKYRGKKFYRERKRELIGFEPPAFPPTNRNTSGWHKRPSIFLPRWASRITLEILKVRVERLTEISVGDCLAEGIQLAGRDTEDVRVAYKRLWDSLHGKGAWDKNPWVWVIEFKKL